MESDFSFIELRIMQKLAAKKPVEDIAEIVGHPLPDVAAYIMRVAKEKNIKPYTSPKALRLEIKTAKENKRALLYQEREEKRNAAKIAKEQKALLSKKSAGRPAKAKAVKKPKKAKPLKELPPVVIFRQSAVVKKQDTKGYHAKEVDYSKKVSVRIDNKTTIYINEGEDPKAAIHKYFENQRNARDYLSERAASIQQQQKWKKIKP